MKINRLNIGEEVRRKVEESGLSKAKFAELLGIARQNIEKQCFRNIVLIQICYVILVKC